MVPHRKDKMQWLQYCLTPILYLTACEITNQTRLVPHGPPDASQTITLDNDLV